MRKSGPIAVLASLAAPSTSHWGVTASVTIGVGASFGIASMATLLERYQIFRQAMYAEELWPNAPGAQCALAGLQGLAFTLGHIGWEASIAHFLLQRLIAREALIGAFYDCFLILGLVALATIIPTLFLIDSRTRNRSVLRSSWS